MELFWNKLVNTTINEERTSNTPSFYSNLNRYSEYATIHRAGNIFSIFLHFLICKDVSTFPKNGKRFFRCYCTSQQYVGSVTSTSMPIFNGLVVSIFWQKMGNTKFLKEEMDGKVFISRLHQHFCFDFIFWKYTSLFSFLTWRVNKYIFR